MGRFTKLLRSNSKPKAAQHPLEILGLTHHVVNNSNSAKRNKINSQFGGALGLNYGQKLSI